MGFASRNEEVEGFVQSSQLAQPLLTSIQMGYGFKNVSHVGEMTDEQLYFLHAAWIERQKLIRPQLDPDKQQNTNHSTAQTPGRQTLASGGMTDEGPELPPHLK